MKQFINLCFLIGFLMFLGCHSAQRNIQRNYEYSDTTKTQGKVTESPFLYKSIKGKLLKRTCASIVIQILDKDVKIGEDGWSKNGTTTNPNAPKTNVFDNVFAVENFCEFPDNIKESDTFSFQIIRKEDVKKNDCVACMMMDWPPSKHFNIQIIN